MAFVKHLKTHYLLNMTFSKISLPEDIRIRAGLASQPEGSPASLNVGHRRRLDRAQSACPLRLHCPLSYHLFLNRQTYNVNNLYEILNYNGFNSPFVRPHRAGPE